MKKLKPIAALLVMLLLFQSCLLAAQASTIEKKSSFEYKVVSADAGSEPGNILVQLYVQSDPDELITTAGATLVINTDYVDVVNKKGEAITDSYKKDMVVLDRAFTVTAAKIGDEQKSFSNVKGLSIASYNSQSKNMYIFICGMSMEGVKISEKSLMASYYLKTKGDTPLPAGSIRLVKESEIGKECPSRALYVSEISSKKEVGKDASPITIQVEQSLVKSDTQPAGEAPTTQNIPASEKETVQDSQKEIEKDTKQDSQKSEEKGEQTPSTTIAEPVTKAVEEMSEAEIEKEIQQRLTQSKSLKLTDAQKESEPYQAYQRALDEAQKVVNNKTATVEQKREALQKVRDAKRANDAYEAYQKAVEEAEKVENDDTATVEQKREAKQKVRDTQKVLEKEFPALAEQLKENGTFEQNKAGGNIWLYIGIGVATVALALIIVLIIKKKKKKVISNP